MQTVSKVIKQLIQSQPYYGILLCGINKCFDESIRTAGVGLDGINYKLYVNQDFWKSLTEEQRYEVFLHEALHIAFFHCINFNDLKDKKASNIAADFEVNSYLDVSKLPEGCLDCTKYGLNPRMGLRAYYDIIMENHTKVQNYLKSHSNVSTDYQGWIESDRKLGNLSLDALYNNFPDNMHAWDSFSKLTDKEKELVYAQIKKQMQDTSKMCGKIPSELNKVFEKFLNEEKYVFNWKGYFRRILGTSFDVLRKKSKRRESKRFEDFDGVKRKMKHKILVAIDTSGSINDKDLSEFFSEINKIYKEGVSIHILECDMEIGKEYDYKGIVPKIFSGGGGTDFTKPCEYYNSHREYSLFIYFTDGYGSTDIKPNRRTIWLISSDGDQQNNYPGIKICIPK